MAVGAQYLVTLNGSPVLADLDWSIKTYFMLLFIERHLDWGKAGAAFIFVLFQTIYLFRSHI